MLSKLKKLSFTDILLFILSFALVANIAIFISIILEDQANYYDEDYVLYELLEEDYDTALGQLSYYKVGDDASDTMKDAVALSDYYEAAVLYAAYSHADLNEETTMYKQKMDEALEDVGSLLRHVEVINEQLGIE